jgi:hypothetical protein
MLPGKVCMIVTLYGHMGINTIRMTCHTLVMVLLFYILHNLLGKVCTRLLHTLHACFSLLCRNEQFIIITRKGV